MKNEKDSVWEDRPLPLGMMMALGQDMRAMERFARLSPAARDAVIEKAANTHSRAQMQFLVASIGEENNN